jgi:hypothetical protein
MLSAKIRHFITANGPAGATIAKVDVSPQPQSNQPVWLTIRNLIFTYRFPYLLMRYVADAKSSRENGGSVDVMTEGKNLSG